MKIKIDANDLHLEYETAPMSPDRFKALCKLAGAAIGGAVLLGAIHEVGFWAIPWGVGALVVLLLQGL